MTNGNKYETPDWNEMVKEQAVREQAAIEQDEIDLGQRIKFYGLYVKPYDDKLAARKQVIADGRAEIKAVAEKHFMATGEKAEHQALTVSVSDPFKYIKEDAVKWAMKQGGLRKDKYVRVKRELNVLKFNADLKAGKIKWNGAETSKKVTVSMDKALGEWALIAELEAQVEAKPVVVKAEPKPEPETTKIKRGTFIRIKRAVLGW